MHGLSAAAIEIAGLRLPADRADGETSWASPVGGPAPIAVELPCVW